MAKVRTRCVVGAICAIGIIGLSVACGGGSSGTGGGSNVATSSSSFLQQYCDLLVPCCSTINKTGDSNKCQQLFGAFVGSAQYDAAAGGKCLDELHAAQSKPTFCNLDSTDSPDCSNVFATGGGGTKQPGEPCSQDSECASQPDGKVRCETSFDSKGGQTRICQDQIVGKAGDTPCVGTKDGNVTTFSGTSATTPPPKGYVCDVANSIYCDGTSLKCTAMADVGGACTGSSYSCVKTAYCDTSIMKCAARLAVDADCSKAFSGCVDGAYCDQTSKKCTAALATGSPCTTSQQCGKAQCVNGKCDASSGGNLGLALICAS
jgi:hypothetical protein